MLFCNSYRRGYLSSTASDWVYNAKGPFYRMLSSYDSKHGERIKLHLL